MRSTVFMLGVLVLALTSWAQDFVEFKGPGDKPVKCMILRPKGMDASKPVPVIVAIPPGDQGEAMARAANEKYWSEMVERGWCVVSPVSTGDPLQDAPAGFLASLVDGALKGVTVEGGKVHLCGVSTGGIAAMHAAIHEPERIASLLVLPGMMLPDDATSAARLHGVPVTMFVGANDSKDWLDGASGSAAALRHAGVEVSLEVVPGQGHVLSIDPERLATVLEARRTPVAEARREVDAALDDFHDAASKADADRYFGHFSPGGVFIGTDPHERWTLAQFREYAAPYFSQGKGWTYTPRERNVTFSSGRDVAWFDEALENAKYGTCRGSGVLVRQDGRWRITQYNLSVPVPNELMGKVVEMIRAGVPAP